MREVVAGFLVAGILCLMGVAGGQVVAQAWATIPAMIQAVLGR